MKVTLNIDELQRLLGNIATLRGHHRYLFADKPDTMPSYQGNVAKHPADENIRDLGGGKHCMDPAQLPRTGSINAQNLGMGERTPEDLGPEHTRKLDVGRIPPRPCHLCGSLHTANTSSNNSIVGHLHLLGYFQFHSPRNALER